MLRNIITVTLVAAAICAAAGASPALAHEPVFPEPGAVTQIPDVSGSYAYYQEITSEIQADTFVFDAEGGQHLHAAIMVPKISGMEDFQVQMVLFGPGLPPIQSRELPPATTFSPDLGPSAPVCEGFGSGIVCPPEDNGDFFDPYTQTSYYRRQTLEIDLPETGTYHLIVTGSTGALGKYVLHAGSDEYVEAGDLLRLPVWWVKVQSWFGHGPWLVGGLVGFAAILIVAAAMAIFFERRRRKSTAKKKAPLAGSLSK